MILLRGLFLFLLVVFTAIPANCSPLLWCEPGDRDVFYYHLGQLRIHVGRSVEDVGLAAIGNKPTLARQLKNLLGDDSTFTKTRRALRHLRRAKGVFDRQFSQERNLADWVHTKSGGVAIFRRDKFLQFNAWPNRPDDVYNMVTGTWYHISSLEVQMFLEPEENEDTDAMVMYNDNTLPQFSQNGEILAINPMEYRGWKASFDRSGPQDLLDAGWAYQMASDERYYRNYDATPAPERSSGKVPVDLLLHEPQQTLLHELFHTKPFGSLYHGDNPSSGWRNVVLGRSNQHTEKEDHPEILAIIVALVRINRMGYKVHVRHGTVHRI